MTSMTSERPSHGGPSNAYGLVPAQSSDGYGGSIGSAEDPWNACRASGDRRSPNQSALPDQGAYAGYDVSSGRLALPGQV
jgi:hypothetical protein